MLTWLESSRRKKLVLFLLEAKVYTWGFFVSGRVLVFFRGEGFFLKKGRRGKPRKEGGQALLRKKRAGGVRGVGRYWP